MISRCVVILFSIISLSMAGSVRADSTASTQCENPNKLVVLGDSLSAAYNISEDSGWVNLLQARLDELASSPTSCWQVINASISGETSGGGAARIGGILSRHQPQLLIVELGGNDGLRGLAIKQFRGNLEMIIQQARQANVKVLLAGIQIPTNYGPLYRKRFEAVYTDLSERLHVPLVPFLLQNVATEAELMLGDGIHPNATAQPIILENIWPYLETLL